MLINRKIEQFAKRTGRRPRILVSSMGKKRYDQDTRLLATIFAETGFDVDISPLHQTPRSTARMAIENDVHIICFLSTENNHKKLAAELAKVLRAEDEDGENIRILVGGTIPRSDYDFLYSVGVDQILTSLQINTEIANRLIDLIE